MICGNNNYVYARKSNFKSKIFLVKKYGNVNMVRVGAIYFPKEFLGKRVRLKVELVED